MISEEQRTEKVPVTNWVVRDNRTGYAVTKWLHRKPVYRSIALRSNGTSGYALDGYGDIEAYTACDRAFREKWKAA